MNFYQNWIAYRAGDRSEAFPARVPGNIQADYALAHGFGDVNVARNCEKFRALEDETWIYETKLKFQRLAEERVWFVSMGIDYQFRIYLNGLLLTQQEGMFHCVELELSGLRPDGENILQVEILPPPKRTSAAIGTRDEADASVKPPVSYGWDFHPRLIPSGMWQEAYVQTRGANCLRSCTVSYTLSEDLLSADVRFDAQFEGEMPLFTLRDPAGKCVYQGRAPQCRLENPELWWCSGQGKPSMYKWTAQTSCDVLEGSIGLRRVELVMNEGAWTQNRGYPASQCKPPITLKLNGRRIFAKGSNWVNPEIFTGTITEQTYTPLLRLAKDANMNLLRCWGGAGIQKESFYALCDQYGLMVWQEFPLACNCYPNSPDYLRVLEQEAVSIIRTLRQHPAVVLWCGGNELFQSWSGMTGQAKALRLLNKLCYELDPDTPFLPTSPLMGMGHGGYTFYDAEKKKDVFEVFQTSRFTAYTEFGVPGAAPEKTLREIIPAKELFPPKPGTAWEIHHAFSALLPEQWLSLDVIERYFGRPNSLQQLVSWSHLLQAEGYKAIFEEARRQKPYCSMALNWCFNEPWKTAANNSMIAYPAEPKPAYEAVRAALRPLLASARIPHFCFSAGERAEIELWALNDSPQPAQLNVEVFAEFGKKRVRLGEWESGVIEENTNLFGKTLELSIPEDYEGIWRLRLEAGEMSSTYLLLARQKECTIKACPAEVCTAERRNYEEL